MSATPDDNLTDRLVAFADGELDAAQAVALWDHLADHPERQATLRWMRDQQRLTLETQRVMSASAPDDLRARIEALAAETPSSQSTESTGLDEPDELSSTSHDRSTWRRRIGGMLALAAALAIGITLATSFVRPASADTPLPGEVVVATARTHAACSRLPETLHKASFAAVDAPLSTAVQASLGAKSGTPDLTDAGFYFVGAGPCEGAGVGTVHLLYRSTKEGSRAAVSVFVQPDRGQFAKLDSAHVYRVSSPTSPFPTLAWRGGDVVFVLLADDETTEASVLQLLRPTKADDILGVATH